MVSETTELEELVAMGGRTGGEGLAMTHMLEEFSLRCRRRSVMSGACFWSWTGSNEWRLVVDCGVLETLLGERVTLAGRALLWETLLALRKNLCGGEVDGGRGEMGGVEVCVGSDLLVCFS